MSSETNLVTGKRISEQSELEPAKRRRLDGPNGDLNGHFVTWTLPDNVRLNLLTFLPKREMQALSVTSKIFYQISIYFYRMKRNEIVNRAISNLPRCISSDQPLPSEIFQWILSFLPKKDTLAFSLTCKTSYKVTAFSIIAAFNSTMNEKIALIQAHVDKSKAICHQAFKYTQSTFTPIQLSISQIFRNLKEWEFSCFKFLAERISWTKLIALECKLPQSNFDWIQLSKDISTVNWILKSCLPPYSYDTFLDYIAKGMPTIDKNHIRYIPDLIKLCSTGLGPEFSEDTQQSVETFLMHILWKFIENNEIAHIADLFDKYGEKCMTSKLLGSTISGLPAAISHLIKDDKDHFMPLDSTSHFIIHHSPVDNPLIISIYRNDFPPYRNDFPPHVHKTRKAIWEFLHTKKVSPIARDLLTASVICSLVSLPLEKNTQSSISKELQKHLAFELDTYKISSPLIKNGLIKYILINQLTQAIDKIGSSYFKEYDKQIKDNEFLQLILKTSFDFISKLKSKEDRKEMLKLEIESAEYCRTEEWKVVQDLNKPLKNEWIDARKEAGISPSFQDLYQSFIDMSADYIIHSDDDSESVEDVE